MRPRRASRGLTGRRAGSRPRGRSRRPRPRSRANPPRGRGPRRRRCGERLLGAEGERACRRGGRLDRPDPADEAVAAVELALGRGDEKNVRHSAILDSSSLVARLPTSPQPGPRRRVLNRRHGKGNREPRPSTWPLPSTNGALCSQRASAASRKPCGLTPRSGARPAIAADARTDGTNVVATRREHELPGAPSCAYAGRDHAPPGIDAATRREAV